MKYIAMNMAVMDGDDYDKYYIEINDKCDYGNDYA